MTDYTYAELGVSAGQSSGSPVKDMLNGAIDFACDLNNRYPDGIFTDPFSQDISRNSPPGIIRREIINAVCGQAGRPTKPTAPFSGGQCYGVSYTLKIQYNLSDGTNFVDSYNGFYGPIGGVKPLLLQSFANGDTNWIAVVTCRGLTYWGQGVKTEPVEAFARPDGWPRLPRGVSVSSCTIIAAIREDGQPDNCGNPSSSSPGAIPSNAQSGFVTITDRDGNVIKIPVNFNPNINSDLKVDLDGTEIIFDKDGISIKEKYKKGDPEGLDKKDPLDGKTPRERIKNIEKEVKDLETDLDKLSDVIGVDEYPASLPESLISKDEGWLGNLIPNQPASIPNLTQLLGKFIEYFDEVSGQWEVAVEVKDSDPSKLGDQPKGIKLPNLAEAIAEMFTLCLQTNINSETLLNVATRSLIETGTDKQQNFVNYKLTQAIADYLGFKTKEKKVDLPLLFTPEKTRYDELLKESNVPVAVEEMDEQFGLEIDLMKLRKAASILDSVYFRKLDPNGDIKAQILSALLQRKGEVDKINDDESDTDWETFLRQAEEGYGNVTGVDDPTKPYGRPYAERPKIKDLTDLQGGQV